MVPSTKGETWCCIYTRVSEHSRSTWKTTFSTIALLWAPSQMMPQGCPLANQLGNHLVACRGNVLPLLLLWCSGQGAYSAGYFFPPQKLRVARGRDGEGQGCSDGECVSCTDTAGGHGEELDGAAVGCEWGTLTKMALQQSSASWLLQG